MRRKATKKAARHDAPVPEKVNGHRPETIHVRRFMDGRVTPEELHSELGIRKRCTGCGGPARVRIRVFAALDELTRRQPEFVGAVAASNPDGTGTIPTVQTKYGPMVKISDVAACALCQKTAEHVAAQAPSWCVVDIDRGPGPDKPLVQVPGAGGEAN